MSRDRFVELVSEFVQANALDLSHEDPFELVVTVGDIRVRLLVQGDSGDGLHCIAEFLDEAMRGELTSPSALNMALNLNFEAHRAEDFHFALDPQGQPVLLARFDLSTLAIDALANIVVQALDAATLHTLITTTPGKRQDASPKIPNYSLRA